MEIDSSRLNNVLLYRIGDILGPTKLFDSMAMLLPLNLPEHLITRCVTITHRNTSMKDLIMTDRFSHNERPILTYGDHFSKACAGTLIFESYTPE